MKLLDSLKFVQGAVATKDYVPALTHFRIGNKKIQGYNGMLSLTCPISLNLHAQPKASTFAKAIQSCTVDPEIKLLSNGKLSVKAGSFKANIPCLAEEFPEMAPTGKVVRMVDGMPILPQLKALEQFISEDASRPWSRGILIRNGSAFATNNVIVVEQFLGYNFPVKEINIPHATINELLRIKIEPEIIQLDEKSVTFFFDGDETRMTSQVYTSEWPNVEAILNIPENSQPPPRGFWDALSTVAPFVDELRRVYLRDGLVTTSPEVEHADASVEVKGLVANACFNVDYLLSLKTICFQIDFGTYPKPCLFFGETKEGNRIRGAIVGIRG